MKHKKIISLLLFFIFTMSVVPVYPDAFSDLIVKQMITVGIGEAMKPNAPEAPKFARGVTITPYTSTDSIQAELNQCADINICNNMDTSPIAVTAALGREDLVEFLIQKGAKLDLATGENGETPLMFASISGKINILKLLAENGAKPDIKDKTGALLTHYITLSNNKDGIEWVIKNFGNVNAKDNYGLTPLDWAVLGEKTVAVKILIEHGADINIKSNQGLTPFDYANVSENQYIITLLKKLNAKTTGNYNADILDNIHCIAIVGGLNDPVTILKTGHTKEIKYLLNNKKINPRSQIYYINEFKPYPSIIPNSFTASHIIAAFNRDPKAVDAFFKATGSINIKERHGITPLMAAAYLNPNVEVIKAMLKDGADLNAHDTSNNYTLGYARLINNFKVINFLLSQNLSKSHIKWALRAYIKGYSTRSVQSTKEIDNLLKDALNNKNREFAL